MYLPLAVMAVVVLWIAAWLIVRGWSGTADDSARPKRRRPRREPRFTLTRTQMISVASAAGVGIGIGLATGWWLAVLIAPAVVLLAPILLGSGPSQAMIERQGAMAEWCRMLASTVAATGIEEAILSTRNSIPAPIHEEVSALIARVRTNTLPIKRVVRLFADDLNDGETGDKIAATLLMAADKRGGNLRSVLEDLATSVDEDVRNRRAIEVERRGARTVARWITVIATSVLVAILVLTSYMEPYKDGVWQIVLFALLAAFLAEMWWMRHMTMPAPAARFLDPQPLEYADTFGLTQEARP